MYEYYDIYGEPARGIEPTSDRLDAVDNGRRFGLEVYDTERKEVVYDPRIRHNN